MNTHPRLAAMFLHDKCTGITFSVQASWENTDAASVRHQSGLLTTKSKDCLCNDEEEEEAVGCGSPCNCQQHTACKLIVLSDALHLNCSCIVSYKQ